MFAIFAIAIFGRVLRWVWAHNLGKHLWSRPLGISTL